VVSDITARQEAEMRRKARNCPLCKVRMVSEPNLPASKELDHILPIAMGGTHTLGNVRIICRRCNQRRPKDGSDYTGQLTLWAQGPVPVGRPDGRANRLTCRKGLHPWAPENITIQAGKKLCKACLDAKERARTDLHQCACGAMFAAPGRTAMCPGCIAAAAKRAAELHAGGLTWAEVASQTGYQSATGAWYAAKRIGYVPERRSPQPTVAKLPKRCDCGAPVPAGNRGQHHAVCDGCVAARAWRAVELYRAGWTLGRIADELGYGSKSSITNLMKSVGVAETRLGRPRRSAA
jgi:hypothetical protein